MERNRSRGWSLDDFWKMQILSENTIRGIGLINLRKMPPPTTEAFELNDVYDCN